MPYETIRYHCNICHEAYRKLAEAQRCEIKNHVSRTVWATAAPKRKMAPAAG
jgi:hypothetical protein